MSSLDPLNAELKQQDEHQTQSKSYKKYEIHEGIIFCIELSMGMFEEVSELNYKIQLKEILESLAQLMSQLVIVRPGTGIGCYFYNCHRSDAKNYIYEFFPLRDINAKNMKKLSDLLDDLSNNRTTLREMLPFDESKRTPLDLLFGFIQDEFLRRIEGQKAFNNKKIFLFTDNDSPPEASDNEAKSRIRHLVDDMDDHFIHFTTFFIGKKDAPFDDSFYSDVLKLGAATAAEEPNTEFDGPNTTPISASYIKSRVLRKQEVKRIMFQCSLILEEGTEFVVGTKGYAVIIQERPGQRYRLVYEKDEMRKEAISRRKFLDANTGEVVEEGLTKVYPYGDLDITITEQELAEVKKSYTSEEAFLKIIGFRSYDKCIHYFNNIDKALFVVPDEYRFEGSIRTLASLFKNLRAKRKVAVVWGKLKANSHPAVFILSPSHDEDPNEGFYLYRIPFAEELRRFPQQLIHHNSYDTPEYKQLKSVTKDIIDHFQLPEGYRPSEYRNPDLQKHFKILHDYLLQVEQEEDEDNSSEGLEQRLLSEDDSLLTLAQNRNVIMESAYSSNPVRHQLSESFELWNSLYGTISKETTLEDAPQPRLKQSRK